MHQALMKLIDCSHNIVRLLDVCEDPNYIYVITEYCAGGDLFAFVHNSHPLYKKKKQAKNSTSAMEIETESPDAMDIERNSPPELDENQQWAKSIRSLFQQLTECISWLHANRFCHRDLSLENVLLSADGTVKVIDFGVCKRYKPNNPNFKTKPGFVGKQAYCSPEVYTNKEYDGRKADCWSL